MNSKKKGKRLLAQVRQPFSYFSCAESNIFSLKHSLKPIRNNIFLSKDRNNYSIISDENK